MKDEILQFLSGLSLFSSIDKKELDRIAELIGVNKEKKGNVLFFQGKSRIQYFYIIREGEIVLYFDKKNKKETIGLLKKGETFGGISILMNSGMMVRNVLVKKDVVLYTLPKKFFLELCTKFESFYEYFINTYSNRMLDKTYASVIATEHARKFVYTVEPFSFIPEEAIEKIAPLMSVINFPKDTTLFIQGESKLEHIYILNTGAARCYYISEDGKKNDYIMNKGDIYGGYCILSNKSIANNTLKTEENTSFYKLPKEHFKDICNRYTITAEYFTDPFGERILKKSYSYLISGNIGADEDTLGFFNNSVGSLCNKDLIFCNSLDSIQDAAYIMSRHKCGSILIKNDNAEFVGIVTDTDLREKVIAEGYNIEKPVSDIMSSPLFAVDERSFIFEALFASMQKNRRHLAVKNDEGKIIGVLTHRDILNAQGQSPFFFARDISSAQSMEKIIKKQKELPKTIGGLITKGAKARHVTRFISVISDEILNRIMEFVIDEIGQPPVKFVFMIMGSDGRQEQTLKTDQDNAIVFEDVGKTDEKDVTAYFLKLGEKVCNLMDKAGYTFCPGNIMAKNPKLCKPMTEWKKYFSTWIYEAEPEDLLHASIFFDFRKGYGDEDIINELRTFLFDSLKSWSGFFRRLTENALHFKPPLGFFRNFRVESKGEHKNSFDIKRAMMPVVDFARIYALHNSIENTNTYERLRHIYLKGKLSRTDYKDIDQAYDFMMQLRFVRQIKAIVKEKRAPDNYINPATLSRLEQKMLKVIFKKIEKFQDDASLTFLGM